MQVCVCVCVSRALRMCECLFVLHFTSYMLSVYGTRMRTSLDNKNIFRVWLVGTAIDSIHSVLFWNRSRIVNAMISGIWFRFQSSKYAFPLPLHAVLLA